MTTRDASKGNSRKAALSVEFEVRGRCLPVQLLDPDQGRGGGEVTKELKQLRLVRVSGLRRLENNRIFEPRENRYQLFECSLVEHVSSWRGGACFYGVGAETAKFLRALKKTDSD